VIADRALPLCAGIQFCDQVRASPRCLRSRDRLGFSFVPPSRFANRFMAIRFASDFAIQFCASRLIDLAIDQFMATCSSGGVRKATCSCAMEESMRWRKRYGSARQTTGQQTKRGGPPLFFIWQGEIENCWR